MKQGTWKTIRAFAMVAALAAVLMAPAWGAASRVVARETAAEPNPATFIVQGETYTYPTSVIPTGKIAADARERTVFFDGGAVQILCLGTDRQVHYEIELTFLSDSTARAVSVTAGNKVLDKRLELPFAQVVTRRYAIPPAAVWEGELEIQVRRLAGPNAVLAGFAVYAAEAGAAPLRAYVPPQTVPALPLLRLTPRPASVTGVAATSATLNGTWKFSSAPTAEFWKSPQAGANWKPIAVPGEWTMQGFTVEKGKAGAYRRAFTVPTDWQGKRVKLRFDGVYAESRVWVNGQLAGGHAGGFTPFELDITGLTRPGQTSDLALEVRSLGSKADGLASGSQYAEHDLGGIPRKVTLLAVPELNIASLHAVTTFGPTYTDARLELILAIANQTQAALENARVDFTLAAPDGSAVALTPASMPLSALASGLLTGLVTTQSLSIPVAHPLKWDNEHPNLYQLGATLRAADGTALEAVFQNVGFRQVEVRGNQLFLNGRAIKLRGACRHETHPTLGRALTPELWEADARLFRDGNVNYIRTSHYPPAEEFLDWCDRLGLLVESEAPFCWAQRERLSAAEVPGYVVRPTLEMVEFNRNHPSVIIWSIGNESGKWREYFSHSAAAVKAADPSRPRNFSGSVDQSVLEIAGPHYPGLAGPGRFADAPRPSTFDEFIHLNCYNRAELFTDPGVRDFWGPGSLLMWEKMRASQGTLGGAIWAAIDDSFFVPGKGAVGYGAWGPIDGWRRPKPEYWHMKKIYSPLRIAEAALPLPAPGAPLRIKVGNRHDFANLSEVPFEWKLGGMSGTVRAEAEPQTTGTLELALPGAELAGTTLELRALDARGFVIDQWALPIGPPAKRPAEKKVAGDKLILDRYEGLIIVHSKDFYLEIDGRTGIFRNSQAGGQEVLVAGPALMVLPVKPPDKSDTQMGGNDVFEPFTAICTDWQPSEVTCGQTADGVWIKTRGAYKEAKGSFTMRFSNEGLLTVDYDFELTQKATPRQIGVVLDIPRFCDTFSWRRHALWTAYPEDHIGRPVGTTKAFYEGVPMMGIAGPGKAPSWPWSHDANTLGCNDFRSTKLNVEEAALTGENGAGVRYAGDASQHVRLWADDLAIRMLIADYANEGGASFFSEHVVPDKHLAPGDRVKGTIKVQFVKPRVKSE